jgi:hypothetical protein
MSGIGKIVYPSGKTYEGDFMDGTKHGKGLMTWRNGNRYDGSW